MAAITIDTGAEVSIIDERYAKAAAPHLIQRLEQPFTLTGIVGDHRITSAVTVPIRLGDTFTFTSTFYIIPNLGSLILLGNDQLHKLGIDISYHSMIITFREPSLHINSISFSNKASDTLNNFIIDKIAERKPRANHNHMSRNSAAIHHNVHHHNKSPTFKVPTNATARRNPKSSKGTQHPTLLCSPP